MSENYAKIIEEARESSAEAMTYLFDSVKNLQERMTEIESGDYAINKLGEYELESDIVKYLQVSGLKPERQVHCDFGIIDILTKESIYEVKKSLNRSSIIKGIGQLLLYSSVYKDRKLVLIGLKHIHTKKYYDVIKNAGIELKIWE